MGIKEYIEIKGVIAKDGGWSAEEYADFVDKIIELGENYGAQIGLSFQLKSEEEL